MYSIRWYNPGTQLFSEYVDVPRFKTLPIPKPVNIDPNKVKVEVFSDHIVVTDNTARNSKDEESKLNSYRVSDNLVLGSSNTSNFVWIGMKDLKPGTTYTDKYGIYWENSSGESNRVKVSFTTLSDTTKSDTTTEDTTTE
ncbi:hypothetical protein [Companilactobacillus versmoldensis]|nr:hypothetical protein [Companilactobacillus versmoldensis]